MSDLPMRERIMDCAEQRLREGGYFGFSFRDIAEDVAIKSASVHYHFPTKEDLVTAVTRRYSERAHAVLAVPSGAKDAVTRVAEVFRQPLSDGDKMCLCGILGAERDVVPEQVQHGARVFFSDLRRYLSDAGVGKNGSMKPTSVIATLEGSLIVARALGDHGVFEQVVHDLIAGTSR